MLTGLAQQVYPVNPDPIHPGKRGSGMPGTEGAEPIDQGRLTRGDRRESAHLLQQQAGRDRRQTQPPPEASGQTGLALAQ